MSDCGGDCGGDTGGDYGGDCGGDYGGDCGDGDVQMTTFDSDYPVETSYSTPDSPVESTHMTYFESNAPAEEQSYNNENNGDCEMVIEEHATRSYSYLDSTNNWGNANKYRPSRTYYNNYSVSSGSSVDCNFGACVKPFLILLVGSLALIFIIFAFKKI